MTTSSNTFDPVLIDLVSRGDTVLFVGAGFSLSDSDNRRGALDKKGLRGFFLHAFRSTLKDYPESTDSVSLEDLMLYLLANKGVSRQLIAGTVKRFLSDSKELARLESFTLLRSLMTLRPETFEAIITTNWDKGLETALQGIPGLRVATLVTEKDLLNYDRSALSIMKIHGDVDDADSLVISSQDFDDYEVMHPFIVERLRTLFATKYVILLGYSAADASFRRLFRGLHRQLGQSLRGGWLVAPTLRSSERIWLPTVNVNHVPATAQRFLSTLVSEIGTIPFGVAPRATVVRASSRSGLFRRDQDLTSLAERVRRLYGLKEVWIAEPRDQQRPNRTIGLVSAHYLEARCSSIGRLAISTGETIEAMVASVDTTAFRKRLEIFSTIVLHGGPAEFKDPSYLVQTLVSRFKEGRARGHGFRLPGVDDLEELLRGATKAFRDGVFRTLQAIGSRHVARAMKADVIMSSARPYDWFGGVEPPPGRTVPIQQLLGVRAHLVERVLSKHRVVAIHHMIPVVEGGADARVVGAKDPHLQYLRNIASTPSLEQLHAAAAGSQRVVLVVAHTNKELATKLLLTKHLCNVLITDAELASRLLE